MRFSTARRLAYPGVTFPNALDRGSRSTTAFVAGPKLATGRRSSGISNNGRSMTSAPSQTALSSVPIKMRPAEKGDPAKGSWPLSRGFSTKLHALVDRRGRPIYVAITPGQRHEMIAAQELLEHARGRAFIGDTGYDSDELRTAIKAKGMRPVIHPHPTRKSKLPLSRKLYRIRYRVECFFHEPETVSGHCHPLREDGNELPWTDPRRMHLSVVLQKLGTPPRRLSWSVAGCGRNPRALLR